MKRFSAALATLAIALPSAAPAQTAAQSLSLKNAKVQVSRASADKESKLGGGSGPLIGVILGVLVLGGLAAAGGGGSSSGSDSR